MFTQLKHISTLLNNSLFHPLKATFQTLTQLSISDKRNISFHIFMHILLGSNMDITDTSSDLRNGGCESPSQFKILLEYFFAIYEQTCEDIGTHHLNISYHIPHESTGSSFPPSLPKANVLSWAMLMAVVCIDGIRILNKYPHPWSRITRNRTSYKHFEKKYIFWI